MRVLLAASLLLGFTARCNAPPPPDNPPPAPISEGSAAARSVASVRRAFAGLLPTLKPELAAWGRSMDALLQAPGAPLQQHVEACRTTRASIQKNTPEIDKLVLAGSLDKLDRDGTCSIVFVAGGMKREMEAVLDADGAEVLLLWRVPEG